MADSKPSWWKTGTCYQVWPASYKDSNGDGIGDLPGVISTLDYLRELGTDIIWLSPMYDSPQKDMGYDISDYHNIYAPYGTMKDMDELIKQCHDRGMKLILDLVINHTSDQHEWFQESKKDKTNPKADWYMWRDPKIVNGERHPPSNWRSIFGGSAWEYVPERDQYYLHLFVTEQPDLNWELETVRRAIYKEAIEFWLDRGIDGFRVDTVNLYSKDINFPDAPIVYPDEPYQPAFQLFENGPRMHEWLQEQRRDVLDKYGDVFMVGECPHSTLEQVLEYVSASRKELSTVFDFDVVDLGTNRGGGGKKHQVYKHSLPEFKEAIAKVENLIMGSDAWGTVFLENHDQARSLSRFATDKPQYRERAAKMLATLLATLTGTLFLYQGQEIGTYNHPLHWTIEDMRDVDSINAYNETVTQHHNDPAWAKKAMRGLQNVGRDNARLPVQWNSSANAGFTTGKPWIRVHDDYENVNIADQLSRDNSPLKFWQKVLKLRNKYQELTTLGDFEIHEPLDTDTFTFVKKHSKATKTSSLGGAELLVMCSFSDEEQPLDVPPKLQDRKMELLLANVDSPGAVLQPWESRIYIVT